MAQIYCFRYAYDKAGNRIKEDKNGTHTYYTYDAANELLARQPGNADHYSIARDGRNVLWGYRRSAGDFSPDARAVFYNIIQYLHAL